jgi:nicotinamide-nucleotide amidase
MAHQAGREAKDPLLRGTVEVALSELAARLQATAVKHGVSVATAESCTGGLVGHAITSNAGASAFYLGGVVSYADAVKEGSLGVPREAITRHGAVSAQVAVAMAQGVRERLRSDFAVAVTGVAGPDGGTAAKPVGLTYVAVAGPEGHEVRRFVWAGDRTANKEASADAAIQLLCEVLQASLPSAADVAR